MYCIFHPIFNMLKECKCSTHNQCDNQTNLTTWQSYFLLSMIFCWFSNRKWKDLSELIASIANRSWIWSERSRSYSKLGLIYIDFQGTNAWNKRIVNIHKFKPHNSFLLSEKSYPFSRMIIFWSFLCLSCENHHASIQICCGFCYLIITFFTFEIISCQYHPFFFLLLLTVRK